MNDSNEILTLIADLWKRDAIAPRLNDIDGLWVRPLDAAWTIVLNGQMETLEYNAVSVDPAYCYVEFNGWPAGLIDLIYGDGEIAAGGAANCETFADALRQAVAS